MKKTGLWACILLLAACTIKKMPETPTGIELKKSSFAELNGFNQDDFKDAANAFSLSCQAIKNKPKLLEKSQIKIDPEAYLKVCGRFENQDFSDSTDFKAFVMQNFEPYLVVYNGTPQGKFTAYYEAELRASKKKHGKYQYPIYGRPYDLIEINLKDFDETLPDKRILGRVQNNKLVPYLTRGEIEKNGLDAPVILWGDDKVDIFLMQIQGSAVALLDDGASVRISYADNNGHRFVGIGGLLLKKGLLKKGEASMDKIRDWLKKNPEIAEVNMNENPRFIFHKISDATGPIGALGVPLTAGRSLAVDTDFVPLSSLLWLETVEPSGKPLQKLVSAQDIGAAIKGAVRGDYFWGHGESALLQAGKMNAEGQFYILMPRK
ncbi:MAG: murein transglycosylase A [Alphaproteobacteria bacterium]|nr:murein transglycosylase A [Alphaproteobacteria bacterium]